MWSVNLLLNKLLKLDDERYDGASGNRFEFLETQSTQFSSSNKNHSRASVVSNFIQVPHINQQHSWDCGLACILMVLRARGIRCNIEELVKHCPTKSIWTVDLAYLLQKFSISFMYFTVTLEANPKFSVEAFYKDQLPNDLGRVNMLFRKAREAGIRIECRALSGNEIADLILSGKYIAIALVDQYKLSHSQAEHFCILEFISGGSAGYTGHYIVICGYDGVTDEFEIRDPASSMAYGRVTSLQLDRARKSFGTDEDLLLISLESKAMIQEV